MIHYGRPISLILHVADSHREQHFVCAKICGEAVASDLLNLLGIRTGTDEDDTQ